MSIIELRSLINKANYNSLISHIWILTILLYLFRTIASPLKYLFFISFGILAISYLFIICKENNRRGYKRILKYTKEFHIVGLFLVLGILLSAQPKLLSIKSLINYLGISFFLLVFYDIRHHINYLKLLKGWLFFSFLIGTVGLLKWLNLILNLNIEWFSIFYDSGSSLVREYNFYAYYFIVSILISFYLFQRNISFNRKINNQVILNVYILNLALSGSRRGLIFLFVLIILGIIILIAKKQHRNTTFYKNLVPIYILFFGLFSICLLLIPFRFSIFKNTTTHRNITNSVYGYSTLFVPSITYDQLMIRLWSQTAIYENDTRDWTKYSSYNNNADTERWIDYKSAFWTPFETDKDSANLLYNGDFKYGSKFWIIGAPDSVSHEIIPSKYGNAIRVSRANGEGHWPLKYDGRKIYYQGNSEYNFKFKFRVIKGNGLPFMIGWGVNEGDGIKSNLHKTIKKLDDDWYECSASYRFKENQTNLNEFMNSQMANTIIDFADIELTCGDDIHDRNYVDQYELVNNMNLLYNSNFKYGPKFWESNTKDRIYHKIIDTEFGKAIQVERKDGQGGWPLVYRGRDIYYYQGLTYTFRFKFRVIRGNDSDFKIGWGWHDREKGTQILVIKKNIYRISNEWFECIGSYTFEQDHLERIFTFMCDQKPNTIFDFTDIEMFCNDTINRLMYIDENIQLVKDNEELRLKQPIEAGEIKLLHKRTTRWKYALELWTNEYSWSSKIFGGGFDYLEKFGQQFYPDLDRVDYPHNPIISSILYSGLLGGLFYIYFLLLSFWYYLKYRKHHILAFILYLVCIIFVFISSDSHFNVPIFALLSLVPFITRSVVKQKNI